MSNTPRILPVLVLCLMLLACGERPEPGARAGDIAGSASCRECHEHFYQLWATSHHGLAMQPFTVDLARRALTDQDEDVLIGDTRFRSVVDDTGGWVVAAGPGGESRYPILHAMGGKNVYYFLTPLERGRLQVLPLAYDVNDRRWFDTAASAVRHFRDLDDEPLDWRHPAYTFNTSCHGCHVSQVSPNYDLATDTYRTTWVEPGINCETCHGPAGEHVRVCDAAPDGEPPADPKIIRTGDFSIAQVNDHCAPCHAKARPLTNSYLPGEAFFDHYDLVTLEHPDHYPDGRDLGENYTQTSWLMSPCVKSGELSCLHCHTSSGRFRQADDPNAACLPCHEDRVENVVAHSRHEPDSEGCLCIACHMPETGFARMRRHDHSMRPPAPKTTREFESPNACSDCHADQTVAWAEELVTEWHGDERQAALLRIARLVDEGRRGEWAHLPEMLAYIRDSEREEVFATSLVRLVRASRAAAIQGTLLAAARDPSPLVRASAVEALGDDLSAEAVVALTEATRDPIRLVRLRAAAALAPVPPNLLQPADRESLRGATAELEASIRSRPDDAFSHYNLANLRHNRGDVHGAIEEYEIAIRLRPDLVMPLVNLGLVYAAAGRTRDAESVLRRALAAEPDNAAAHFNLGLLLGEQDRRPEAVEQHRAALKADPRLAAAAFNLGVLLADEDPHEALSFSRRAADLAPDEARYAYTLGFYQRQQGHTAAAVTTLTEVIRRHPGYGDAYVLLGSIHEEDGRPDAARELYRAALEQADLPVETKYRIGARLEQLSG